MPKHSSAILEMARKGATHRYHELRAELAALAKAFPHLYATFDKDELPVAFLLKAGAGPAKQEEPRKRRKLSAAAKASISAAQKKRWAKVK